MGSFLNHKNYIFSDREGQDRELLFLILMGPVPVKVTDYLTINVPKGGEIKYITWDACS